MTSDLALLAERRAGLAALFGLLLLEEPGPAINELVAGVPTLASLGSGDERLAVEYERVFLRGVPLYESGFRSEDGQLGGSVAAAVAARYEQLGSTEHREARWRVAGPDHLGLELRCYATLCHDEAEAWRSDVPDAAMKAVEAERSFLADHVSAWAPVAVQAAARAAGTGPYRALLDALGDFLGEEHERLRPAPDVGVHLPIEPLPTHLGPARLGRLLLAPATCGAWLTAPDIEAAAAAIGVPWRPSDTRTALRHVIESATETDEFGRVVMALMPAVARARDRHLQAAAADPGNGAHWRAWAARAEQMELLLEHVARVGFDRTPRLQGETIVVRGADAAVLADAIDRAVAELQAAGLRVERVAGAGDGNR